MLIVSDVDDVFLPKPTDLLLNIAEAREGLEALLQRLPGMFQENPVIGNALGSALQAGFSLIVCLSGSFRVDSSLSSSLRLVAKS